MTAISTRKKISSSSSSSSSSEDVKIQPLKQSLKELKTDNLAKVAFPKTGVPNECIMRIGTAQSKCEILLHDECPDWSRIFRKENKGVVRSTKIKIIKEDAKKNTKIMVVSTGIGVAVGSAGWAGGPVGGAIGMSLGGLAGFVVGGIYINHNVTKKMKLQILVCDQYTHWRSAAIATQVFPIFKLFLNASKEFKDLLCPLTKDVISFPMKAPDGFTYEKDAICDYLEKKVGKEKSHSKCRSPMNKTLICKDDLVFDLEYCKNLIQKSKEVYGEILKHEGDIILKHGVYEIHKNTVETITMLKTQVEVHYYKVYKEQRNKGLITQAEMDIQIAKKTQAWDWGF